jgi:hypothetical protein
LRKRLGDDTIDFKPYGGYELFLKEDESSYNECLGNYRLSMKFYGHLRLVFSKEVDRFGFTGIQEYLVLILLKHKLILEI